MSISSIPSPVNTGEMFPTLPICSRFRALPPPLIIVGMHRSGTSLAGGMLHGLGVYIDPAMGVPNPDTHLALPDPLLRRSGYGEAIAFRLLNEAVLRSAGAAWNHIQPFLTLRDAPGFAYRNLLRIELATYGSLARQYLAPLPRGYESAWGWKDPRNSLTLPYWLRLFPDARILHVRRDSEAVARSLMRRAQVTAAQTSNPPTPAARLRSVAQHPGVAFCALTRRARLRPASPSAALDMSDRHDCLRLAELYVAECLRYQNHRGGYLEVPYERLLEAPDAMIDVLADFVGIAPSREQKQRAAAFVVQNSA